MQITEFNSGINYLKKCLGGLASMVSEQSEDWLSRESSSVPTAGSGQLRFLKMIYGAELSTAGLTSFFGKLHLICEERTQYLTVEV